MPRYILFDLAVRAAWFPDRSLGRLCPMIEASDVDHYVTAPDESAEHYCQPAVSKSKRAFLDRKNLEAQERIFDLPAITG